MEALIELLKTPGIKDLGMSLIVFGWIARELVALRKSVRDQGKRIGALAAKMATCEAKLNIKPPADDGGS